MSFRGRPLQFRGKKMGEMFIAPTHLDAPGHGGRPGRAVPGDGAVIRVTVDLRSAISSNRSRELAVVTITNDGRGTGSRANYDVMAERPGGRARFAKVEAFPRRSRSALELLRRALNALADRGDLP